MARPRTGARAGTIVAAPQPVASTERAQPDTKAKAESPIARLFRAARKALLDEDEEAETNASRKRKGETGRAIIIAAVKLTASARLAFRAVKTMLTRPAAPAAEAFGPPDPCDPFNPAPLIGEFAFTGHFEEAMPPAANGPSANL